MKQLRNAPVQYWKEQLGHMPLVKIHPAFIAYHRDVLLGAPCGGYLHKKLKPRSPSTVWQYLQTLHRIFSIAKRELHIIDTNPVSDVIRPSLPKGRTRFLSDDEVTALLASCKQSENEDLHCFVLFALTTGARKGELLKLQWTNVDVERRWAVFERTKNGTSRGVPLTTAVLETLMLLQRAGSSCSPRTRRAHSIPPANVPRFRRHLAYPTTLCGEPARQERGYVFEVGRLLGHKDIRMSDRYARR